MVLSETYVARGRPDPDASAAVIVERLRALAPALEVVFAPTYDDAIAALRSRARAGDVVLCCGAGPVDARGPGGGRRESSRRSSRSSSRSRS